MRRFEKPNRPVILTGMMANWPLYTQLESWKQAVADMKFKVGVRRC